MPGQRIRALRKQLGLSQIEFAALLDVSNVTVNRWEHDRALPQPAMLIRLERAGQDGLDALREVDPAPRGNLPHALPTILGREADLQTIIEKLVVSPLVTLTGPGGIGKTRLALETGIAVATRFGDRVWFVDLALLMDGNQVVHAIAQALHLRESGRKPLIERLIDAFTAQPMLLILDNCEHLLPACIEIAQALIQDGDLSRLLATSRTPLGVRGEAIHSLKPLAPADAGALFIQRARENQADLPLDDDAIETISRLCERLDRLPLAIELAAARSHLLTVEQIAQRIDRRFELLRSNNPGAARKRTLDATIAWSCDLLEPEEARLFRRLGVFTGWFDLPAVEAICSADDALDLLDRLIRQSMVVSEHEPGQQAVRYRLLESLAAYARRWLAESDDAEALFRSHATYYAALASAATGDLRSARHLDALQSLDRAYDNIAAALDWLISSGLSAEALALAASLAPYWHRSAAFHEGSGWLQRALDLAPDDRSRQRARGLAAFGLLIWPSGRAGDGAKALTESIALARETGDRIVEAEALGQMAMMLTRQNDLGKAEAANDASFAIWEELASSGGLAGGWLRRGNIAGLRSDFAESERAYHRGWDLARKAGDLPTESSILANLGELAAHTGNYAQGLDFNNRAREIHRLLGDTDRVAITTGNSAELKVLLGEFDEAVVLAEQAVTRLRASGNQASLANFLYVLGVALASIGAVKRALASFRDAIRLDEALNNRTNIAYHIEAIARLQADGGNALLAARLLGGAEVLREQESAVDYAPFDRAEAISRTRAALGADRFSGAWEAGRQLSLAGLLTEALHLGELVDGAHSLLYTQATPARQPKSDGQLTERQVDVLRLVALGRSNREIARDLAISERTVERHLTTIYDLLGVDRRSAAVSTAVSRGLLDPR
jgi:predicted ATPase/DNA-binding CsgD family transcriptional regulator/DNA-binding XRE family transcriptional regulator